MFLRKMLWAVIFVIRESDGAGVAMHVLKAWQEQSQRSVEFFSWVVSLQLLTGGRPVVHFSRV